MGASKIVNESEVIHWMEEGRTYAWMVEEYKRKYNIETVQSMWGNFRRTRGLPRRIARNDELIPWHVKPEHRWAYPLAMLRVEGRRREGRELRPIDVSRVAAFTKNLHDDGLVVHYDPDTEDGFFYVPKREGIDNDLVRVPRTVTKLKATD